MHLHWQTARAAHFKEVACLNLQSGFMVDSKIIAEDEQNVAKLAEEINRILDSGLGGKPYLFVLETLHELDREGNKSKLSAQWGWRSNIDARVDGKSAKEVEAARSMMSFLAERLKDVVSHPEFGIAKKYKL